MGEWSNSGSIHRFFVDSRLIIFFVKGKYAILPILTKADSYPALCL